MASNLDHDPSPHKLSPACCPVGHNPDSLPLTATARKFWPCQGKTTPDQSTCWINWGCSSLGNLPIKTTSSTGFPLNAVLFRECDNPPFNINQLLSLVKCLHIFQVDLCTLEVGRSISKSARGPKTRHLARGRILTGILRRRSPFF